LDGIFSIRWKSQKIVLLHKCKGSAYAANSYRPLCLLNIVGKLSEDILYTRIEAVDALSDEGSQQYGFRKGKSILDTPLAVSNIDKTALAGDRWLGGREEYYAIVTLDVKNAFNTARWAATQQLWVPCPMVR